MKTFSSLPLLLSLGIHLLVGLILFIYYLYKVVIKELEPIPGALEIHTFRSFPQRPLVKFTKSVSGPKSVPSYLVEIQPIATRPDLLKMVPVPIALVQLKLSLPVAVPTPVSVPKIDLVDIEVPMTQIQIGAVSQHQNAAETVLKPLHPLNLPIFTRTGSALRTLPSVLSGTDDLSLKTQAEKAFLQIARSMVAEAETNMVDIVLLVDASKSMADDIAMVRNHIHHIIQSLTTEGIDFTLGLAIFRYTSQLNPIFRNWTLTKQIRSSQKIEKQLSRIRCHGGERTREAVIDAAAQVEFRSNTSRRFILVYR